MSDRASTSLIVGSPSTVFEDAVARVQDFHSPDPEADGHIVALNFGGITIQCAGDGSRQLAEGLRLLADKVETAHRDWLRRMAATGGAS